MGRGGNTGKSRARESSAFQALAPCGGEDVDDLDAGGKCHGEIDVAARDMEADAVRDQRHADEQQERQRKRQWLQAHADRHETVSALAKAIGRERCSLLV